MEPTFVINMFNVHLLLVLNTEIERAPYDLHGDDIILYFRKSPTMSTASHNSNESMPDESMEVIGPEDLEDSPPPADEDEKVEEIGEVKEVEDVKEVGEVTDDVNETEEVPEVVGDAEGASNAEAVVQEEQPQTEKGDVAVPSAAAVADDDDPPLELLEATPPPAAAPVAAPEPVVAPEPVLEASPAPAPQPAAAPSRPPVVATRPQVTPARPAATLEEEDDEEDDDFDETLSERLIGLTEMFPQFMRTGSVKLVSGSWSLSKASFSFAKSAAWVVFSTATILFMPVMIETERLQLQDAQKAQKNQILLGPGVAQSGGPSLGPPPI